MKKEYFNEQNGLRYTLSNDGYYYPLLDLNDSEKYLIGKYGRMRKRHLQEHHSAVFNHLILSNKLNEHLYAVDLKANAMLEELVSAMAKAENCNTILKMQNQMQWVGLMNNYHACAQEIVLRKIVY